MGISDTATIKIFQPFFVQMTLPYSVIRGEEIPVTVTIFNYLPNCVAVGDCLLFLKGYGNIFLFGLSIRTFGVIAISVVNFFEACSFSEILKDKRH